MTPVHLKTHFLDTVRKNKCLHDKKTHRTLVERERHNVPLDCNNVKNK